MNADSETIAVYDQRAADYAARFNSQRPGRHLRAFMAELPEGAKVLDLGSGPGNTAAILADAGFSVEAYDASPGMVALAREKFGLEVRLATFDDLDDRDVYDGIWANFSLLHAPRDKMDDHLSAIAAALKPGGLFHIGMKTGVGEARDRLGRSYTFYTIADLRERLATAGMTVFSEDTGEEAGLAGTVDPWVVLLARKHG